MTDPSTGDLEVFWDSFLESVRPTLSSHVLETWLRPIRCVAFDGATARLEVRDQFSRDWLTDHYLDFIRDGLTRQAGHPVSIEWRINPDQPVREAAEPPAKPPAATSTKPPAPAQPLPVDGGHQRLNNRYRFDNFVCGPSNEFAFAAAKAVADKPGASYNPLFLFGGVGLGKTHLLTAIGHHFLTAQPPARVVYGSAEAFTNEVINAVLGSKLEEFRHKYRRDCDIMLIDDIQLLAGKDRTQTEFFHIFNTLYDSQRQIVVTSDKLPHEIPEIEERLRSRFQWGLIADIQPPEVETRIAILRKKAETEGISITDDVAFFLANTIRSNVRELEGAFVRLLAHASLTGATVTVDYARSILADVLNSRPPQASVESIQKVVAQYFQVRVADLKSRSRHKTLVRPRQVAMFLARKHTSASFPDLGARFGDKDHTTIMSACNRVDALLKTDASLRSQVLELERQLDVLSR